MWLVCMHVCVHSTGVPSSTAFMHQCSKTAACCYWVGVSVCGPCAYMHVCIQLICTGIPTSMAFMHQCLGNWGQLPVAIGWYHCMCIVYVCTRPFVCVHLTNLNWQTNQYGIQTSVLKVATFYNLELRELPVAIRLPHVCCVCVVCECMWTYHRFPLACIPTWVTILHHGAFL